MLIKKNSLAKMEKIPFLKEDVISVHMLLVNANPIWVYQEQKTLSKIFIVKQTLKVVESIYRTLPVLKRSMRSLRIFLKNHGKMTISFIFSLANLFRNVHVKSFFVTKVDNNV